MSNKRILLIGSGLITLWWLSRSAVAVGKVSSLRLSLRNKDSNHATPTEITAIKQMIEGGIMEGCTSPKKCFRILELTGNYVKVQILDKYKRESTGKMEWLRNTLEFDF